MLGAGISVASLFDIQDITDTRGEIDSMHVDVVLGVGGRVG